MCSSLDAVTKINIPTTGIYVMVVITTKINYTDPQYISIPIE